MMIKLMVISLCTQGIGVMKEHFIYYCKRFAKKCKLYCITNDNIGNNELGAIDTLNISYRHSDPLGYFDMSKIKKIKDYIDKINPDVIFVLTHHTSNIFLSNILKDKIVVYDVHDPIPHIGTSLLERFIIQTQLKQFATFSKKFIVAANDVKEKTLKVVSFNNDDIEVIPLAVLDNYIDDEVKEYKDEIDLLFYGKIKKYKGLDTFVNALIMLENENIKPQVRIVGGTNIKEEYNNISYIPDNVFIEGYADDKLLISYIKKSKALVLPYHEATGTMAIGQAFYYGTPVIATNVGCFTEYVGDGGLICEHSNASSLANTIKRFLNDIELQDRLAKNAKKIYKERFMIDNIIDRHLDVFKSVLTK